MITIPDDALREAVDAYSTTFGHEVPDAVIAMYATRPGVLVAEIRQSVRLLRPVPGWREHAKRAAAGARVV